VHGRWPHQVHGEGDALRIDDTGLSFSRHRPDCRARRGKGHHGIPAQPTSTRIDGEIELVDPGTDEVRNFRIGVQSKATEGI
jgi:hypothetical protein